MEIHVKNYEFASDSLIKPYILNSNKFKSDVEPSKPATGAGVDSKDASKEEEKKEDLS
jgi:hypothetical protein